jgi:hypothetical protein
MYPCCAQEGDQMKSHAELQAWLSAADELMAHDMAAGKLPLRKMRRPLMAHELDTDYKRLEDSVDTAAKALAAEMQTDRLAFIGLLSAYLAPVAAAAGNAAVAALVLSLAHQGLSAIPGASELVERSTSSYLQSLESSSLSAARQQLSEASDQGVEHQVDPSSVPVDHGRLGLMAQRLATAPHLAVLSAASDEAYRLPVMASDSMLPALLDGLKALSPDVLYSTLARPAVQQSDGLGRQAALQLLPVATAYYASELLDSSTCPPCDSVDGRTYSSLAEGQRDYPNGGYYDCDGGDRCRGTLIASWRNALN